MNKSEQIKKFKQMCEFYKIPTDLIDFQAEVDEKLNYEENKEKIEQMISTLSKDNNRIEGDKKTNKKTIKDEKREQERIILEQLRKSEQYTEKEFEKSFKYLKENDSEIINNFFKIPINFIKSVSQGYNNSFIFLGKQGQGKSTITLQTLLKENSNFIYKQGFLTPLSLYKTLYDNRQDKILVFDDVAGLVSNFYSLSLILSALWSATDKRKVSWNSTSGKLEIPTEFIFNSKIIFIANKIPNNEYAEVVMSRCLNYEINLSYRQLLMMMTEIAKLPHKKLNKEERIAIVDFIKEHTDEATKGIDLRLQKKIENLYLYDKENWEELSLALLGKKDKKIELVKKLLLTSSGIKEMLNDWKQETGLSKSQFYRYKTKLEQERVVA